MVTIRTIITFLFALACTVPLAAAVSCPSCCCAEDGCLCPFWDNESCEQCFNQGPCPPCLCPFGNESCYENWNMFGNYVDIEEEDTIFPDKTGTIKPGFYANQTGGNVPLTVQFMDTSTGDPNIWGWDFGDGTNSALQNPVHAYTWPGNYTVTLTVKKYVKDGTRESLMTAKIYKPDYINAGGQVSSSQGTASESANTVVSSPSGASQAQGQSTKIFQPTLITPYVLQGVSDPFLIANRDVWSAYLLPIQGPAILQASPGPSTQHGQPEQSVFPVGGTAITLPSVPVAFLLGHQLTV